MKLTVAPPRFRLCWLFRQAAAASLSMAFAASALAGTWTTPPPSTAVSGQSYVLNFIHNPTAYGYAIVYVLAPGSTTWNSIGYGSGPVGGEVSGSATWYPNQFGTWKIQVRDGGSPTGPIILGPTTVNVTVAAPTANAASSITTTRFYANWTTVADATTYYLDVSTSSTFASYLSGYQNRNVGSVTTFEVPNLSPGTAYYYRIRAGNSQTTGPNSNTRTVWTKPSAPTAISASSVSSTGFTARWNATTGASSYRLDVSTSSAFSSFVSGYQDLDVGNVTSRSVTGLSSGTTYYYRVRGRNSSGSSASSGTVTVLTKPAAPGALSAISISTSGFTARWNSTTGATGYRLDVSTSSSFSSYLSGYQNLSVGTATSRSVMGLSAGTTYYYRVRAENGSGASANSGTITAVTLPVAPAALSATSVTTTGFTARWNSVTGATGYRLDVSTSSTFASYLSGYQNLSVGTATTRAVSGLSAGTTYYYRVRAENTSGASASSAVITTPTLPAAPTAATSPSIGAVSFTASWSLVSGATTYKLDVSTSSSFASYVSGYQNLDVGAVSSRSVTGLTAGTRYYYRVRAANASGSSANSNTISVWTDPPAPAIQPATNIDDHSFTANWSAATSATSYRLNVSTSSNFSSYVPGYENLNVGNVTTWEVTGLERGTTYYYRVRAYNSSGAGSYSAAQTVTTTANRPWIVTEPVGQAVVVGSPVAFTVQAGGAATLTYQWKKNGDINVQNDTRISGATSATLTITDATFSDNGSYRVVVTNSHGVATSVDAALVVEDSTVDTDGDGIPDVIELQLETDPNTATAPDSGGTTELKILHP